MNLKRFLRRGRDISKAYSSLVLRLYQFGLDASLEVTAARLFTGIHIQLICKIPSWRFARDEPWPVQKRFSRDHTRRDRRVSYNTAVDLISRKPAFCPLCSYVDRCNTLACNVSWSNKHRIKSAPLSLSLQHEIKMSNAHIPINLPSWLL